MPLFPSSAAFMIPWGEGSFGHCVRCKNCCPLTSDGRELWGGVETGEGGEKAGTAYCPGATQGVTELKT